MKKAQATQEETARPRTADVDVVRLSHIVEKNLRIEEEESSAQMGTGRGKPYGETRKNLADGEKQREGIEGGETAGAGAALRDADVEVDFEPHESASADVPNEEEEEEAPSQQKPVASSKAPAQKQIQSSDSREKEVLTPSSVRSNSVPSLHAERVETPLRGRANSGQEEADVSLVSVLFHPTEDQIRPIVLNKRIEKIQAVGVFDPSTLPMRALTAEEILSLETEEQLNEHFTVLCVNVISVAEFVF